MQLPQKWSIFLKNMVFIGEEIGVAVRTICILVTLTNNNEEEIIRHG